MRDRDRRPSTGFLHIGPDRPAGRARCGAVSHLIHIIRLDSTNPLGNETKVANYLKKVAGAEGISNELLGADRTRLNFIAHLNGSGTQRVTR